jgi:hypothetical protein
MKIKRPPDFIIGNPADPYMLRWYLIPRNRWFNIYLHKFLRSDDDRALHDHPWVSLSIVIKGQYRDHTPCGSRIYRRGSIIFRRATAIHRVELIDNQPAWTLFITGPKVREWGFHCPKGWVHWEIFTKTTNSGMPGNEIGRGCE